MAACRKTTIDGFAYCRDPACLGYACKPVRVVCTTASISYMDIGGDMPGVQTSHEYLTFADPLDRECEYCGKTREPTKEPRPEYGHAPAPDTAVAATDMAASNAMLAARVAQLEARLGATGTIVNEPAVKRGPGRPRKNPLPDEPTSD